MRLSVGSGIAALALFSAAARAQTPASGSEIWPSAEYQLQLPGQFRFLALGQLKDGMSYDAQQWIVGGTLAYQWQRILGRHTRNIDEDKEHHLVLGVGYEYLQTNAPTPQKDENRLTLAATFQFRPGSTVLLGDENRYEYRWVNGDYSTRYRNKISAEFDLSHKERPIRPYVSAEFFYDITKSEWNEEEYSAGLEWPVWRRAKLQTYYLYQTCTSCAPRDLNVLGIGLQMFGVVR